MAVFILFDVLWKYENNFDMKMKSNLIVFHAMIDCTIFDPTNCTFNNK